MKSTKTAMFKKRKFTVEEVWFIRVLKCLDVVQICVKGRNGVKVYLEALCIPEICSALKFSHLTEI